MSKILIGVITHSKQRYCLDEFIESLNKQTIKADVLFVVNNGESAYATLIRSKNFECFSTIDQTLISCDLVALDAILKYAPYIYIYTLIPPFN